MRINQSVSHIRITTLKGVYADMQEFLRRMEDESVNVQQYLGLAGRTKQENLNEIGSIYTAER